MVKLNVYNKKAEVVEELSLSSKIFGIKVNEVLVHQAVVTQMANERQVLAHTKVRSEVRGGGKKPWRQKGTGRARVGSSRSPIWRSGGVIFGPTNDRNFKKEINKKMKQKAMFMAISDKIVGNSFLVLDNLEASEFKTKIMNDILIKLETKVMGQEKKSKAKRSILFIIDTKNEKAKYSVRNLNGIKVINQENLNIVDIIKYKKIITAKDVVVNLEKIYNK